MKENTIKIIEPKRPCRSPEHEPPMHKVYTPGTWKHTCPQCGKTTTFEIPLIEM